MTVRLGSNIQGLVAQRQLAGATARVDAASEKLCSGLRINRASDDAAGLAISEILNAKARIFGQGLRNLNDGISALQIAQGASDELQNITARQLELSEQAANGVYQLKQRMALDREARQLTDEFNRIIGTTSFNGRHLLTPDSGQIRIQGGIGIDGSISFDLGNALSRSVGGETSESTQNFSISGSPVTVITADLNNDGTPDLVTMAHVGPLNVRLGRGDGTFGSLTTIAEGSYSVTQGDFNNDGNADLATARPSGTGDGGYRILLGKGDGTFKAAVSYLTYGNGGHDIVAGDVNSDGILDVVTANFSGGSVDISLGNGDGTFRSAISYSTLGGQPRGVRLGDFNSDGSLDIVAARTSSTVGPVLFLGRGDGSFGAARVITTEVRGSYIEVGDLNHDSYLDIVALPWVAGASNYFAVMLGSGDGTFKPRLTFALPLPAAGAFESAAEIADLNGDGILDLAITQRTGNLVTRYLGGGEGSFIQGGSLTTGANPEGVAVADLDGDGVPEILTANYGSGNIGVIRQSRNMATTAPYLDLYTQSSARQALDILQCQLTRIVSGKGAIGVSLSRLETAAAALAAARENVVGSSARITDVDVSEETAVLIRSQIVQQVSQSILGQANQAPRIALDLLRSPGA